MEGYKGNKTFGKDKYLTHDSPEVSNDQAISPRHPRSTA